MGKRRNNRLIAAFLASAILAAAGLGTPYAKDKAKRGWDHYKRRAKILKRYKDRKVLDDRSVLAVLKDAGVLAPRDGRSGRNAHKSFAQGFRPFKVRVYKGTWLWPLRYGVVSSEYGRRWGRRHKGIDIAADDGDKVYAAAPGEVLYSSSSLKGYGNVVILRHDNEITSLYAHNSKLLVKKGQRVRTGQVIARVGSTGRSTGPHVHFEIRKKHRALNPRKILPKSRF